MRYWSINPDAHAQFGYVYKDLALRYIEIKDKYLKQAVGHFNAAIGIDSNNASAHNGRASIYIIEENYDEAIKESEKGYRIGPKILVFISWSRYRKLYESGEIRHNSQLTKIGLTLTPDF